MNTARAVSPRFNETTDVIDVEVTFSGGRPSANPTNVLIPWEFSGTVRWTIDSQTAHFIGLGVVFDHAPFSPHVVNGQQCEMQVDNNNPNATGTPFEYDFSLVEGPVLWIVDPTVENESPPPGGPPPEVA